MVSSRRSSPERSRSSERGREASDALSGGKRNIVDDPLREHALNVRSSALEKAQTKRATDGRSDDKENEEPGDSRKRRRVGRASDGRRVLKKGQPEQSKPEQGKQSEEDSLTRYERERDYAQHIRNGLDSIVQALQTVENNLDNTSELTRS